MAQTYANNTNVLSKVKLGETTYYLKDAAARAILDTFGSAALKDTATTLADGGTGLVTADQVYDFVIQQIGGLGTVINLLTESDHTAVTSPAKGDFVVESSGKEWLYDGTAWREVGDESAYVLKTTTIAGVDLQDSITQAELQQALGLKALAYKDNGSVTYTKATGVNSFTTGAAGTYNVSGTAVSVPQTYSALDVTPAGSVTITAGTAAAASYDKTTSVTVASAAPAEGQTANYTPAGSVTVTNVTVSPSTTSVATVTDSGTAYSLTDGSVSKGNDTTSAFATEGVVAAIDQTDSEMLVLTTANTSNAVTASGAVTYTKPTLSGSLPTFGSATVVDGISSASASASFSGTGTMITATPNTTATNATVTQPTFTGSFSGTSKSVTPTVATSADAAPADATVTVSSETITPTLTTTSESVSVTFGTNA